MKKMNTLKMKKNLKIQMNQKIILIMNHNHIILLKKMNKQLIQILITIIKK